MTEHEGVSHKNQDGVEQKHRHGQKGSQPLSEHFHTWDEDYISISETPFQPQVEKHSTLLTMARSDEQRANITLQLQQNYGNRYVQRLIESMKVQTKMTVNPPGDIYEQEADRIADTVMNSVSSHIHRQEEEKEEEEEEQEVMPARAVMQKQEEEGEQEVIPTRTVFQRQEEIPEEELMTKPEVSQPTMVSEDIEEQINKSSSGGQVLADSVRNSLEPQFERDFSNVRVHDNNEADKLSQQLGAEAFTTGSDIFFREGAYQPDSSGGRGLIAHELTHTIQQGAVPIKRYAQASQTTEQDAKLTTEQASTGLIIRAQLVANLQREQYGRFGRIIAQGPIRFRLPTTAAVKSMYTSGNVPKQVVKDSITTALNRMAKERRLRTTDPVTTIINRIFPAPGTFSEIEYEKAVDVTDRSKIYETVLDAQTKVAGPDKPNLILTMNDAIQLIQQSAADDANLKLVFGTKESVAKTVYNKAVTALNTAITNIDTRITTDYNLDDPEVGLGGWASYATQHIHLEPATAKVTNPNEAKITILHEACHLADTSVDDKGYYGSSGFEAMSEDDKVTNAAHFEEIPKRILGTSTYGNTYKFTPGQSAAGTPLTFKDKVRRQSDEYLRKAWDKAVDVHMFLRSIRKEILAGNKTTFNAKKAPIKEISELMHLTIHQQTPELTTINTLDIVLAEGVARGMMILQELAETQTVPTPPAESQDFYAKKIVEDSIKAYNALTGNLTDDKKLIKWLVKEYQKPF